MIDVVKKLQNMNDNNRIIIRNIIGAFLVKGGALIISFCTMPAFIRYFDNQQVLGVWFTILSVLTWILSFDLGIGNGLRNNLVKALAENNINDVKKYISSSYFIIGIIVVITILLGYSISSLINWNIVFNISEELISREVMLQVVRCIFIGIMIQFFLRLISSILYALQMSAINNFLTLVTSTLQLIFILLVPSLSLEKNLIMLSYAYIFFTNIPLLLATIIVFSTKLKGQFPTVANYKSEYAKSILSLGGIFFLCQIMYMVIMNTNEFFITQYIGPQEVVEYQIYNKLFSLVGMLFTIALTPVWSAITKAISEKNFSWLQSIYIKLKKIALIAIGCEFLVIPILQFIINIWIGENAIQINYIYSIIFAIFGGVFIYQTVLSTIVCGIGNMKLQAICYTIGVILKFIIIHFGVNILKSWTIVTFANIVILIPYCILQQIALNRYIKVNMKRGEDLYV